MDNHEERLKAASLFHKNACANLILACESIINPDEETDQDRAEKVARRVIEFVERKRK